MDQESSRGKMSDKKDWVVLKFGGTSVASRQRWETIRSILETRLEEGYQVMVVCSALSGVSNLLQDLTNRIANEEDTEDALGRFRQMHEDFCEQMDADFDALAGEWYEELSRLVEGTRLIGQLTDEIRARIMSTGEFISTRVGADWLNRQGIEVAWRDVRQMLTCLPAPVEATQSRRYLSASCAFGPDDGLAQILDEAEADVVVTQGFVASDEHGQTVLLGRGGSDTSAAYLAARLRAKRLEIWTDVPGMFTTNPKDRPDARLLRLIGYEEAQVLAAMGARVLHPRCIPPVRNMDIPLHIRCTLAPEMEGTVISSELTDDDPDIKAVATRHHLYMFDISCPGNWHLPGILSDVTTTFRRHGLSIDMIVNSPQRITLTLDPAVSPLGPIERANLLRDLRKLGEPELTYPVGSVSLVGSNIGSVISKLAGTIDAVENKGIHMVSQAAHSDGLSFVLAPDAVNKVMDPMHDWLLSGAIPEKIFGPAWQDLEQRLAA